MTSERVQTVLTQLREHLVADRATNVGFPSTFDFDYTPLWPLFNFVLNNVGDPYTPSAFPANTKSLEKEVGLVGAVQGGKTIEITGRF